MAWAHQIEERKIPFCSIWHFSYSILRPLSTHNSKKHLSSWKILANNNEQTEGDDTGYGQALFPVPADDPNDPLQWPNYKKTMILIICAAYSFLGNSSLLGPSVYIGIFSESFGISPATASGLISYPNLAYGFGRRTSHCGF